MNTSQKESTVRMFLENIDLFSIEERAVLITAIREENKQTYVATSNGSASGSSPVKQGL